jgi:cytochrome P450
MLVDDPGLIPGAIEEVLRYEAPSPVQARFVTHEVEIHGTTVPEGSVLLILTAAANCDEREFENPDDFDVRRKIEHHVTFGYGLPLCMGAPYLARLEGVAPSRRCLRRFPSREVDIDRAERAHTSTVRGWHRLPVMV